MDGGSSVDWETDVYARGEQLNRWPFDAVVSEFSRRRAAWRAPRAPRVLEVGFGAGNNLWFLADAGFEVSGVEMSATATRHARERLESLGLEADLHVADLAALPFEDSSFDFVLDRGALTQNLMSALPSAVSEIHRTLVPGGCHLSFTLFSEAHPDREHGAEVEPGTRDHFTHGFFTRVGRTSFFNEQRLRDLFAAFSSVTIAQEWREAGGSIMSAAYSVVAVK